MESEHNRKLTDEMDAYRQLERQLKGEQEDWEERMALFAEKHAAEVDALQDDFDKKLDDKRAEREQLDEQRRYAL